MTEPGSLSSAKRALLERALRERRRAASAGSAIAPRGGSGPAPLSYSQQRMWFLQQWEPEAPTFNGARAIRLRGRLDAGALQRALSSVVARHESLRTVVVGDREPRQVALEEWSLELPRVSLAEDRPAVRERTLRELLQRLCREPFDLAHDLMLRATLIELSGDDNVLLLRMHHIAADASSDPILFGELAEVYNATLEGRAPSLPDLPIQYADYAVWQRERLRGPQLDELVVFWTAALEGAPALLELPTDRPRPAVQRHKGAHHRLSLPGSLIEPLLGLGREERATFYMLVLAAFSALLYRWSGERDIVIGSPIANRTNVELQGLIGFFTNTIALRVRLEGNPSFREVVRRAREASLAAYAHQDLPFEKVVEALRPKRDPSYNPLFQVNLRAHAGERPSLRLAGLETELIPVDIGFSRFDLALELQADQDELSGYFEYDRDLFESSTAAQLVEDLAALLEGAGTEPDRPILAIPLPHGRRGAMRSPGRSIARRRGG